MPAGGVISLYSKLHDVAFVRTDLSPPQQGDVPIYETSASKLYMGPGGTSGGGTAQFSLGVSDGGNTAGQTGITGTRIVLAGGGEITLSQATDASGATITASAPPQSVQTQGRFNLTLNGNTAGVLQEVSSGTLSLAGGNGITLSQNGNAITISGSTFSQSVQPETQTFVAGVGNSQTTYTSGTVRLSELGAVTIRSTTGQALQISVAPQSVQPETQTFLGGLAASNTTYTSGTVSIVGSGDITVSSGTGQRVIIFGSQSVQPETQTFLGGIAASDTTYTSGTVRFTGVGGGVTVSSNTGQRVDISVAAPVAQTNQTIGAYALGNTTGQSSSTTFDARTVSLRGDGAVSLGYSNGSLRISAPTQTVQTQNVHNVTLSGNTAGALAEVSSGTMTLAGGNNITLSQNGNAITISGANVGGAQTGISGVIASDATYTSGTVEFTGSNIVTIRSSAGQRVVVDASQSVQSVGLYALGNTTGESSSTTRDARSLSVRGDGIVSVGYSNGSLRISASQSVQPETQTFIGGIANTETTYTSGTVKLLELGAITIRSTTGNQFQLSVNAQTGTQFSAGLTNAGNTAGDTGTVAGRLVLVGSNNITLSGSTNGASQTVSIVGGAGAGFSGGVSNIGNTAGNTGVTGTRLVLAGGQSITLSQSTDANGGTVTISGQSTLQTNQSLGMYALGNTTAQSSSTTMDARTLSVRGDGIVSVGYSNGSLRISASQSVQPETQTFLGGIAASDKTYTSGTVVLTGAGGGITVQSNAGQTITLSVAAPVAQTNQTLGMYAVQNTTGQSSSTTMDARTLSIAGDGAVSVGYSAGSLRISAPVQTVESQSIGASNLGNTLGTSGVASGGQVRIVINGTSNITISQSVNGASATLSLIGQPSFSGGVSNLGNTGGATGVSGTRMVLVGSDNITISQTTDANGNTVSFFGPSPSGGGFSAGLSTGGNTAGNTGVTGTRLVLVGTNNISLSQATDANGGTISINNTVSAFQAGASTGGNTAGDTGVTGTRLVFVGSSPISLSQATGANGGTLSVLGPATSSLAGVSGISLSTNGSTISIMQTSGGPGYVDRWDPYSNAPQTFGQQGQGTLHIQPMGLPQDVRLDRVMLPVVISNATNSSFSISVSQYFGIYTRNASTLSLVTSISTSTNFSGSGTAGSYSLYGGRRWQTAGLTTTLSSGDYWVGIIQRSTTGGGAGHSISQVLMTQFTNATFAGISGILGVATNNTNQLQLGYGTYSVTTAGLPSAIQFSELTGTGSLVMQPPIYALRSGTV